MTAGMCLALSICDKITWFKHQVLNPYAYTRTFIYRYCSRSKKFKSVWNHIFILPFSPLQTNKQNQQLPNRIFVNWRRRRNTIVTPQLKCIFVWFFWSGLFFGWIIAFTTATTIIKRIDWNTLIVKNFEGKITRTEMRVWGMCHALSNLNNVSIRIQI